MYGRLAGGAAIIAPVTVEPPEPPAASDADLELELETELPVRIPVGRGTAVFVAGTCFHRRRSVRGLDLLVAGRRHRVTNLRMPRLDLFRALHPLLPAGAESAEQRDESSPDDPELRSYRSGFWATVPLPPRERPGALEVAAEVKLDGDGTASARLGEIEVFEPELPKGPSFRPEEPELIAICMATFDPDPELFAAQVDSIRRQTDERWVCLISDDCSRPGRFEAIRAEVAGDDRFRVARGERRVGFYRNFERALAMAPPEAGLVAFADQDDRWHPDKLEALRGALGDAQLVYSDQRLVRPDGEVLAETYWTARANNHTNFASLLIANTVTGAASLFRRGVAELALPFPQPPGEQYHDHWVALVAMATGEIAYVDRPLYDYVQHGEAALGHAEANIGPGLSGLRSPLARLRLWRRSLDDWRFAYFAGYARTKLIAEALAQRLGPRLRPGCRRVLRRIARAERSPLAAAWLAARLGRARRGCTETLGAERLLLRGIAWRRLIALRTLGHDRPRGFMHDASIPSSAAESGASVTGSAAVSHLEGKIEPLELAVSEGEPERVNLLVPTIDLAHLFGGYIAKFNLARRLARSGMRVRIVTVDRALPLPRSWRRQVESYSGLEGLFDEVEVAFGRDGEGPLETNPRDRFVATTFWTAHIAHAAVARTERSRFLYLIQEYEPYTFVMGSWAAVARSTYDLPHAALFSTEMLRDFFAARGYGVFAGGAERGRELSAFFRNAITPVGAPGAAELAERSSRRFLFYARPEPHAARNMFELGLMALTRAVAGGLFDPRWEINGIGSVGGPERLQLGAGRTLELLPRRDQAGYAELLRGHDAGMALMLTPHPSLVPIEMASAAMAAVTNTFETKTADALGAISPNLIAGAPSLEAIVAALGTAVERAEDPAARARAAAVDWPSAWDESLGEDVMRRVSSLLELC